MRVRLLIVTTLIVVLASPALNASWLSDITGINVDLTARKVEIGQPRPEAIPNMLANLPKDIGQALLAPHGQVLAGLIRQAANEARSAARPIPPEIASQLRPYFPSHVLARAMWAPTDPNRFSIDTLRNMLQDGAITLDNIIVFVDSTDADPRFFNGLTPANKEIRRLWAHEMTHVMQYTNMGIESFATVYSVNWESLESQARAWANQVEGRLEAFDNSTAAPTQAFYSSSSMSSVTTSNRLLTIQDYVAAARRYYPPSSCIVYQQTAPQAMLIQNVCPIPVFISGMNYRNFYTGFVQGLPCVYDCVIPGGITKPFGFSFPGTLVNVFYRY